MTASSRKSTSSWASETGKFAARAVDLEFNSRPGRFNLYGMIVAAVILVVYIVLDREAEVRANFEDGVVAKFGGSETNLLLFMGLLLLFMLLFVGSCMLIITWVDGWHSRLHKAQTDDDGPTAAGQPPAVV